MLANTSEVLLLHKANIYHEQGAVVVKQPSLACPLRRRASCSYRLSVCEASVAEGSQILLSGCEQPWRTYWSLLSGLLVLQGGAFGPALFLIMLYSEHGE